MPDFPKPLVRPRVLTVLQILPALESGGVEKGTLEIARALTRNGYRSLVMSQGGRLVAPLQGSGSGHFNWPVGRKSLWTLRLVPRLRRFLRDQRVDIVHARSRMPAWLAYLAWKGMDPRTRPGFITTVHGFYSVNRYSAVMTRGERVIAVSDSVRRYVLDNYPDTDPARLVVIHRGIDRALYPHGYVPPADWLAAWQREHPQLEGRFVLTLPGRITRLKGHGDLLEVLRRLLDRGIPAHGLIVGEAPARRQAYRREIEARAQRLGLGDHVTFTGHRSDLREIMSVSGVVLSLSTTPESFGRTTLEALSLGRPVMGYDHGGVGEQLAAIYPEGGVPLGEWNTAAEKAAHWWRHAAPPVPHDIPFTLDAMCHATLHLYESLATPSGFRQ
jgi:glycosyltransferase involved in cell wall biosynthesis